MHTQNKEGNYSKNNISDKKFKQTYLCSSDGPATESVPWLPDCLMQLFKRFTENSVMELYWRSYLYNANAGCKAVSGKAPSLRPFDYGFRAICGRKMNVIK